MVGLAFLTLLFGCLSCTNGLVRIAPFESVTGGISDAWIKANLGDDNAIFFDAVYGNNTLWLISQKGDSDPPKTTKQRGIVSALQLPKSEWSHKTFEYPDGNKDQEKLFSLKGRLFMLTFDTTQQKVIYRKLFTWTTENRWLEIPLAIISGSSTVTKARYQNLAVNVPDQNDTVAYCAASSFENSQGESELAFSRLDVEFRAGVPVKATLKPIARQKTLESTSVVYTATTKNILYAFIDQYASEGAMSVYDFAYAVDLKTNKISKAALTGTSPGINFDSRRILQTSEAVLIIGGYRITGIRNREDVRDIWSLNLKTLNWDKTNGRTVDVYGTVYALDQERVKLYATDLSDGVHVAQIAEIQA